MKVLVINAGSSSIKYQLFDMPGRTILAKGMVERIGSLGAQLGHNFKNDKHVAPVGAGGHDAGMGGILATLTAAALRAR